MASKSSGRFVVTVNGSHRAILSIGRPGSGDLILSIKSAEEYRDPHLSANASGSSRHGAKIVQQRYTVHQTLASDREINVLQQSLLLSTGEMLRPRQTTQSMKRGSLAHVFSRRCPDLSAERYRTPKAEKNVSLGRFDPRHFTLVHSVFVGSDNALVAIVRPQDMNIVTRRFGRFTVLIIWSFLPLPAHTSGMLSHSVANPDDTLGSDYIHPGFYGQQCVDFHAYCGIICETR